MVCNGAEYLDADFRNDGYVEIVTAGAGRVAGSGLLTGRTTRLNHAVCKFVERAGGPVG